MAKPRPHGITDEQIIETYLELRAGKKVAQHLGLGEATIYRVLMKHGVKTDGLHRYRKSITRFQGQEAEIRAWYDAGEPLARIRERLGGASDYSIKHAIRRAGGTLRANPVPTVQPGEVEAIEKMLADGVSQAAIARQLGRSQSFVWRTMKDRGIRPSRRASGESHGRWNGGRHVTGEGYWAVRVERDDAMAVMRRRDGYVLEHRLVMARALGRPLAPTETVHHIDGDRTNNRTDNLQLRQGKHGKGYVAACLDCGSHNVGSVPIGTED